MLLLREVEPDKVLYKVHSKDLIDASSAITIWPFYLDKNTCRAWMPVDGQKPGMFGDLLKNTCFFINDLFPSLNECDRVGKSPTSAFCRSSLTWKSHTAGEDGPASPAQTPITFLSIHSASVQGFFDSKRETNIIRQV